MYMHADSYIENIMARHVCKKKNPPFGGFFLA